MSDTRYRYSTPSQTNQDVDNNTISISRAMNRTHQEVIKDKTPFSEYQKINVVKQNVSMPTVLKDEEDDRENQVLALFGMRCTMRTIPMLLETSDNYSRNNDEVIQFNMNVEFTQAVANIFCDTLRQAMENRHQMFIIVIDSPGGEVGALNKMVSVIETAKGIGMTIVTICTGLAASCGAVLLSLGTRGYRFASADSTIMIHEVSAGCRGTRSNMKREVLEVEWSNSRLFERMAVNAGIESDYYNKLIEGAQHDVHVHPERAVQLHIIDHAFQPYLEKKTVVQYTLKYEGVDVNSSKWNEKMIKLRKQGPFENTHFSISNHDSTKDEIPPRVIDPTHPQYEELGLDIQRTQEIPVWNNIPPSLIAKGQSKDKFRRDV